jgi:hypothetical protein
MQQIQAYVEQVISATCFKLRISRFPFKFQLVISSMRYPKFAWVAFG